MPMVCRGLALTGGPRPNLTCPMMFESLLPAGGEDQGVAVVNIIRRQSYCFQLHTDHGRSQSMAEGKGCSKPMGTGTRHPTHRVLFWPSSPSRHATHPPAQDLVDGCTFFQRAFSYDLCSHFLHIQHECIKRFLYVGLLLFFFLFGVLMLSGWGQNRQMQPNEPSRGQLPPQQKAHPLACSTP